MGKLSDGQVLIQVPVPKALAMKLTAIAKKDMLKRTPWLRIKLAELAGWRREEK